MYKHKLPFTVCFTAAMFIIFFYCAAEFPIFFSQFASFNPDWSADAAKAQACYANSTSLYYGPGQLQHWIKSGVGPPAPASPALCPASHTRHARLTNPGCRDSSHMPAILSANLSIVDLANLTTETSWGEGFQIASP